MNIKKLGALCITFAAIGAAGVAPAQAASGSVDTDIVLPPGCDFEVWWNTSGNPMMGAEVGNPTYCVRRILAPIIITTVDLPPLNISAG